MTHLFDDWSTVVATPATVKDVAAELLALADSPAHVRTIGGAPEFLVHPDVAEAYTRPADSPAPKPRRRSPKKDVTEHAD